MEVKKGEVTDIEQIFAQGKMILEAEIVDMLLPNLEDELLLVGQAKGKFGGGQRRIFRQTQKKTKEGNKIHFLTYAAVGNKNGYVGVGTGKSKETVPARDKSKRKAKLNLMRVRRGCGSWECNCKQPHSVPFASSGKCGSVEVTLMPAPKGKGLCVEKECAKILELAGIKDVWSRTSGQTKVKVNLIAALMDAIKNLSQVKLKPGDIEKLGIVEGKMKSDDEELPTVAVEADSETEVAEEKTEEVAVEEAKEEEKVEVKEEKTPDQAELTEAEADSEASEEEKEESS
ncbi:30S ribosomal protein S5 [Candidatus Woesearchaeota archaeon]|nr:30S ribosomal protein S5 [Candidatus Woesearchaeota archaeon]MBT4110349.1 30S ribosomal protein S5 [Candidatus Woesearchaeota archaeon]MBT4336127.1 30S ribosomal protein S5 [Candidatus Woesearchaeota archaeon]MBT4468894.1 30S ribosomal protein S5 [Candidatus Woesearchaeota archaeon]MBT6744787.1 30S ribosomal protein S5 [Candidatus Woesearchaeota archaeon]